MWVALATVLTGACAGPSPTFNKDMAPFFWQHCASCHRPEGAGPFSLLTYEDVRGRLSVVASALKSGWMPPWLPEHGYGDFVGERHVTPEEIARFDLWMAYGAPRGEASDLPVPPSWPREFPLGEPDLVLELPEPFALGASGADVFRNFVLPIELPTTKYVRGVDVRPGSRNAVHHATILIDSSRESRRLDEADSVP